MGFHRRRPIVQGRNLRNGLISFWELEEASGDRADSHGTNTLTDTNTVTQNTGKIGNAAEFLTANSERLIVADNASLSYSGDFSVVAWFYFGAVGAIVSKVAFSNAEWSMRVISSGGNKLYGTCFTSSGTETGVTLSTALSLNTWYMGVLKYNAATRVATVSLNAGLANLSTRGSVILGSDMGDKSSEFQIGAQQSGSHFTGRIDQVGFWKRHLTNNEEAFLYNNGNGRSYSELF